MRESVETLVSDFWHIALTDATKQLALKLVNETAERIEAQAVAAEAGSQIDLLTSDLVACREAVSIAEKASIKRDNELDVQKASIAALQTEVAKKSAQVETLKAMLTEFSPNKKQKSMEFSDKA